MPFPELLHHIVQHRFFPGGSSDFCRFNPGVSPGRRFWWPQKVSGPALRRDQGIGFWKCSWPKDKTNEAGWCFSFENSENINFGSGCWAIVSNINEASEAVQVFIDTPSNTTPMVPENDANITAGWWYTYPSEKYESQLGLLFPMYGKKNVPNHQPDWVEIRIIQKSQQVQWERLLWRSVCHVRIPMDPNRTPRKSNNSSTTVVIGLVSGRNPSWNPMTWALMMTAW